MQRDRRAVDLGGGVLLWLLYLSRAIIQEVIRSLRLLLLLLLLDRYEGPELGVELKDLGPIEVEASCNLLDFGVGQTTVSVDFLLENAFDLLLCLGPI